MGSKFFIFIHVFQLLNAQIRGFLLQEKFLSLLGSIGENLDLPHSPLSIHKIYTSSLDVVVGKSVELDMEIILAVVS